jgi:anthranilate synthase component 2
MKPILLLDNYDSFTYNLRHYIEALGAPVVVYRNDEISLEEVAAFDHIVLSPGPGLPHEAGILNAVIARYANEKAILGICLGMQAIGEVFGAKLQNLNTVHHGVTTVIDITDPTKIVRNNSPLDVITRGLSTRLHFPKLWWSPHKPLRVIPCLFGIGTCLFTEFNTIRRAF